MVCIWGVVFLIAKCKEEEAISEIDFENKTVSDYSLLFNNLPKGMRSYELENHLR